MISNFRDEVNKRPPFYLIQGRSSSATAGSRRISDVSIRLSPCEQERRRVASSAAISGADLCLYVFWGENDDDDDDE